MARQAKVIDQVTDFFGDRWDVREKKETPHGWLLLFGWPHGVPRGKGGSGGPRAIVTADLAGYLDLHRARPIDIDLPCGRTTIKRLRHLLGHDWREDNQDWWLDRLDDLASLTTDDFATKHLRSTGAVSTNRALLVGGRQRPAGWWAEPEAARVLLRSSLEIAAETLGIAPVTVRKYRAALRDLDHADD